MSKRWSAGLAAVLAAGGAACTGTTTPEPEAVVVFAFRGYPQDTLRVEVADRATIQQAEAYVRTGSGANIPIGPIVRGAGADARYPFHFVPGSVRLAEAAMEMCDGAPMRTAAQVEAFFGLTGRARERQTTYCPWSAYPVAVVPAQ